MKRFILAATLAIATAASSLRAQVTGATVVGKVTDSTGSPVSSALVAVLRPSTGIRMEVKTNDAGGYTVPNLVPGSYNLTVSADKLGTQELRALTVAVGENLEEDFTLSPATAAISVATLAANSPCSDALIIAMESTFGSSSIACSVRPIMLRSLKIAAVTSTGLRAAANGTQPTTSCCASGDSGVSSSPPSSAASAINTPAPPDIVITASRRDFGSRPRVQA